jgi:hypothetical protein
MEIGNWKLENGKWKREKGVILSVAKNLSSPKRPLTRPAAADESAAAAHPLPRGEGCPIDVRDARLSNFQFPFSSFYFPFSSFDLG